MSGKAKKKEQGEKGLFETNNPAMKKASIETMHFVYEAQMERMDSYVKKLFILCMILVVLLFGTNVAWFAYKTNVQTVDTSKSRELDSTGKMIALKPIYYTTDYDDEMKLVSNCEESGDLMAERTKKRPLYIGPLAIAC